MKGDAFSIELEGVNELKRELFRLGRNVWPKAAARAVNRTANTVRSRSSRELAKRMGLKVGDVRDATAIRKARPEIEPTARLSYRGRPFNLTRYRARQTKKGVSAAPYGKRRIFAGTFMLNAGGSPVMKRESRGGVRVGRLPITPLYGPGIADEAASPDMSKFRERLTRERLIVELRSQLEYRRSR